jgi:hypothetical protein
VLRGPEPGLSPSVGQRVLEGGTSISWRRPGGRPSVQAVSSAVRSGGEGGGTWRCSGVVSGTLLGPEGSGRGGSGVRRVAGVRVSWTVSSGVGLILWRGGCRVGGWGAGCMLRTSQWTRASLWLKFLRALGGCLGTRNRRRT